MTPRTRAAAAVTAAALLTAACAQAQASQPGPGHPQASQPHSGHPQASQPGPGHPQASQPGPGHPQASPVSSCPQSPVAPHRGAPASLGLNARGVPPPLWSSAIGNVAALDGRTAYTMTGSDDDCVLAVNTTTGQPLWNWSAPAPPAHTHPQVMAITAGRGVVIVATGHSHGAAPAAVYSLIDQLTALNASTGQQLWTLTLTGGDGQWTPDAITGGIVIVTEADGTVVGLDAKTGTTRWTDPLPATCHSTSPDPASQPVANLLTPEPVVSYDCSAGTALTAPTPATGRPRWTWHAPRNWSPSLPAEAATSAGVTAVLAGQGPATAPSRHTWTLGPRGYDPVQIVAIDDTTGRPVWVLDDVAASAGVYAGDGQICAASPYGDECLNATTGTEDWRWRPAVTPRQESGPASTAAATNGRLYLIAPVPAAARIDSESTTQRSAPGTFTLQARDITTGHLIATRPLPAYYGGPSGVVASLADPPAVTAAEGRMVLVTPEDDEAGIVEAFDMMSG